MTDTWFSTEQRIEALLASFKRWKGTPFWGNSMSPGPKGGVSCQKLVEAILRDCGFNPPRTPDVAMNHGRYAGEMESVVVPFLESMEREGLGFILPATHTVPIIGDILGFKIGKSIHHVGIFSGDGQFFHVIDGETAGFANLSDPTWFSRLRVLFRLKNS